MSYWQMGGYAVYVWPAYGISLVVLALNIIAAYAPKGPEDQ